MPLHTVEEAAELMKVSPDTVREWVRSGRLRASKLAGSKTLRISTDDITAFYDANETRSGHHMYSTCSMLNGLQYLIFAWSIPRA